MSKLQLIHVRQRPGFCGPASLVALLAYYDLAVSEEEMARLCGTSEELGTSHVGMLTALNHLGFNAIAHRGGTWDDLVRLVGAQKPVVVNWYSDYDPPADGHYSVVVQVDDKKLTMMDPELGSEREISREKFMENWHDYIPQTNERVDRWYLYLAE